MCIVWVSAQSADLAPIAGWAESTGSGSRFRGIGRVPRLSMRRGQGPPKLGGDRRRDSPRAPIEHEDIDPLDVSTRRPNPGGAAVVGDAGRGGVGREGVVVQGRSPVRVSPRRSSVSSTSDRSSSSVKNGFPSLRAKIASRNSSVTGSDFASVARMSPATSDLLRRGNRISSTHRSRRNEARSRNNGWRGDRSSLR